MIKLVAWGGLATNSKKPFKINDLLESSGTIGGPPTWCTQKRSIPDSPLVAAPKNMTLRCTNNFWHKWGPLAHFGAALGFLIWPSKWGPLVHHVAAFGPNCGHAETSPLSSRNVTTITV